MGAAWGWLIRAGLLGTLIVAAGGGIARADFVVRMCDGNPPPPWVEGMQSGYGWPGTTDTCTSVAGTYAFNYTSPPTLTWNQTYGAGLDAPGAETFSHVTATFHTLDVTTGSLAFLRWGYGGTLVFNQQIGDDNAGTQLDSDLPDATNVWFNVYCSYSLGPVDCTFPSSTAIVSVASLEITVHDTTAPTVSATGGSLAAAGTYAGQQTLLFTAADDNGSGVAKVTVSLGGTVVGTSTSSCQPGSLQPCPASASGALVANTALVPDGSYPVVLTAYDASGDATPVQVATVTIANQTGATTITPPPAKQKRMPRVTARVVLSWRWNRARTVLTALRFNRLPRDATVVFSCHGPECPITTVTARRRRLARAVTRVVGRAFHAGEQLLLAIAAPGHVPEVAQTTIRRDRLPVTRLSPSGT